MHGDVHRAHRLIVGLAVEAKCYVGMMFSSDEVIAITVKGDRWRQMPSCAGLDGIPCAMPWEPVSLDTDPQTKSVRTLTLAYPLDAGSPCTTET